jgi:xanthine/uracil permease
MTDKAMGAYSDPNSMPPMGQAVPLGLQHVLAMFASNVTPSIIVAGAAGLAFGSAEQIYLIQMAMLFAGVATIFQTVGFGPVGARMPIMQGTSFAFVGVLAGISATQGLGVALTACIIGGLIHFALGSVIGRIRFLFPPLVTGLVILAIGLYLIPVGIKYAAGGAADFQMAAESFGSLKHWTVALTVIIVALLFKFKTSGALSNAAILIGFACRLRSCSNVRDGKHGRFPKSELGHEYPSPSLWVLNLAWARSSRSLWCQSYLLLKRWVMRQLPQKRVRGATQQMQRLQAQRMQTV